MTDGPAATIRVTGPEDDAQVELQLGELELHARGARTRRVKIEVEAGEAFEVALLGPDGSCETAWDEPVAATEVWERLGRSVARRGG